MHKQFKKKLIKVLSTGTIILSLTIIATGCASNFNSMEYLTDEGKEKVQMAKKHKGKDKYNAENPLKVVNDYNLWLLKDDDIVLSGKVKNPKFYDDEILNTKLLKIELDMGENNKFIENQIISVYFLAEAMDTQFKEGDKVTVYGEYKGDINNNNIIFGNFLEVTN